MKNLHYPTLEEMQIKTTIAHLWNNVKNYDNSKYQQE